MNRLARLIGFAKDDAGQIDQDLPVDSQAPTGQATVGDCGSLSDAERAALREAIIAALRTVYDPEIPVNLYDLGLIYRIEIAANADVSIDMTLTAPGCPVAGMMPGMVRGAVEQLEHIGSVEVALVWDPPWSMENMSEEARLQLGLL